MTSYCNDILPKAEELKVILLKKYEKEHEQYKLEVAEEIKRTEKARDEALKKAERDGKTDPNNKNKNEWEWKSNWPLQPSAPSAPFLPDPSSLAMAGSGASLSGISYSNIMEEEVIITCFIR